MRRTRKWAYVQQEAQRLADLRLSPKDIADKLGVRKSTVTRWIASGKLARRTGDPKAKQAVVLSSAGKTPQQWATAVREAFDLDATDEQLVDLAESSLLVARDPASPGSLRLQAMGRFQALVKQLALVTRAADAKEQPEAPKRKTFAVQQRTGTDPRGILMGVD